VYARQEVNEMRGGLGGVTATERLCTARRSGFAGFDRITSPDKINFGLASVARTR
jgi:hypothetical protein